MKDETGLTGKHDGWPGLWLGHGLLAWIIGTGAFFYIRFTFAFVHANLEAIRGLLDH